MTIAVARTGFLREFVRAPRTVAAVAPSSPALAAAVVAPIPLAGDPVIVELGPGTGSFTTAIQHRLAGRGRHLAVEINPRFAESLTDLHPRVDVVTGNARDLVPIMAAHGLRHADVIVSGLPWAAFTAGHQDDLLNAVVTGLAPEGVFTTFAYTVTRWTPPARRLHRRLTDSFEEVVPRRTVWGNLPPAFSYVCRRPRPAAATAASSASGRRAGAVAPPDAA